MRYVIVNADDLGRSAAINRAVVACHEGGIVTSASLMVRWPAAEDAAAYARAKGRLSVGLHVDLAEWVYRRQTWVAVYQRVALDDESAVRAEVDRQLADFRRLVDRDPTHLDSHQHVHRDPPVASILCEYADELGVPLRHFTPAIRYCGDFFGQTARGDPLPGAISVEALITTLTRLPSGVSELACHPGEEADLHSPYGRERELEARALSDPRVPKALRAHGIELVSFADVGGAPPAARGVASRTSRAP